MKKERGRGGRVGRKDGRKIFAYAQTLTKRIHKKLITLVVWGTENWVSVGSGEDKTL